MAPLVFVLLWSLCGLALSNNVTRSLQGPNILKFALTLTKSDGSSVDINVRLYGNTNTGVFTKAFLVGNPNRNILDAENAYTYDAHPNDIMFNPNNLACPVTTNGISYARFNTHFNIYKSSNGACKFVTLTNIRGTVVLTLLNPPTSPTIISTTRPTLIPTRVPTRAPTSPIGPSPTLPPSAIFARYIITLRNIDNSIFDTANAVAGNNGQYIGIYDINNNAINLLDPTGAYQYEAFLNDRIYDPSRPSCPVSGNGISYSHLNTHINIYAATNGCGFLTLDNRRGIAQFQLVTVNQPTSPPVVYPTQNTRVYNIQLRTSSNGILSTLTAEYIYDYYTLLYLYGDVDKNNKLDPVASYNYDGYWNDIYYDPSLPSCPVTVNGLSIALYNTHINIYRDKTECKYVSLNRVYAGTAVFQFVG